MSALWVWSFQIWGDKKVLKLDSDGCTILCMYLMPLLCTLKWLKWELYSQVSEAGDEILVPGKLEEAYFTLSPPLHATIKSR